MCGRNQEEVEKREEQLKLEYSDQRWQARHASFAHTTRYAASTSDCLPFLESVAPLGPGNEEH